DFIRYLSVNNTTIWSLDKPKLVNPTVRGQLRYKTDVWTFRSFNRTNPSVVASVNVADFEFRACTLQTTRPKARKTTLVRQLAQWVGLIHKGRKLVRAKKALNARAHRLDRKDNGRQKVFVVCRGHSFASDLLHPYK